MITPWDILTSSEKHLDREKQTECTTSVRIKAADLAERITKLLDHLGFKDCKVSSGFRTTDSNAKAGGAKDSAHLYGMACDIADPTGLLSKAILANPEVLRKFDLYCEDFKQTPTWCHFQIRKPPSGNRIFGK